MAHPHPYYVQLCITYTYIMRMSHVCLYYVFAKLYTRTRAQNGNNITVLYLIIRNSRRLHIIIIIRYCYYHYYQAYACACACVQNSIINPFVHLQTAVALNSAHVTHDVMHVTIYLYQHVVRRIYGEIADTRRCVP